VHPPKLTQLLALFSKRSEDVAVQIELVDAAGVRIGCVEHLLRSGSDANGPGCPSLGPLFQEIPFTVERVCAFVKERESYGKRFTIMVVAEGVKLPLAFKEKRRAGSMGNLIGNAIATSANKIVLVLM